MDAKVIYGNTNFPFRIAKVVASLHSHKKGNYNVGSVLKSIELFQLLQKHKKEKNVVHYLNGERDIRHLGFLKRHFPNTIFCATFHKPPEILKKTIANATALRNLDGAIAVGINQVDFLKEWLQLENVKYIPHGVDTHFFVPDSSKKKKNTLLFVGQHLRDFETFNKTVPKLNENIKNLNIQAVVHPAYASKIEPHDCIEVLTNIKDKTLRTLYQEATALYLPMVDSTACNSILEAMACGLPIITSKVGGNEEYLKDTSNILITSDRLDMLVLKVKQVIETPTRLETMECSSRKKAIAINWEVTSNSILDFYNIL
tara:strand:- start:44344 stop:45288 length:945 start_codon:yes stop_codon:yes gene_type:complete